VTWVIARATKEKAKSCERRGLWRAARELREAELRILAVLVSRQGVSKHALNMAASAHRALGEGKLAWEACAESLTLDPSVRTNRHAWTSKGALLREGGAFEEAVQTLQGVHAVFPEDVYCLRALISACGALAVLSGDDATFLAVERYAVKLAGLSEAADDPIAELKALAQAANGAEKAGLEQVIAWLANAGAASPSGHQFGHQSERD
jgi:hypothetical protein